MSAGPLAGHRLAHDPVSTAASATFTVGQRTMFALSDGFLLMSTTLVGTPDDPSAGHRALSEVYGEVRLPIGCFLVPGEPNVLIDTGLGPHDLGGNGRLVGGNLLPALARLGFAPDDVGVVALSHLHGDHAGTIGDPRTGLPVFARARTIIGAADWAYFVDRGEGAVPMPEHTRTALLELDRCGLIQLVEGDVDVTPAVRRIAAPGHTPGHSLYAVHDGAERIVLLGDAMHCPQQLSELDWSITFDVDPGLARRTRQQLVRDLEVHGGGALGCHFPELHLGRMLGGTARARA